MATPRPSIDRAASETPNVRSLNNSHLSALTDPQSLSAGTGTEGSGELAAVVDDLLNQLSSKFTSVSSELLAKSEMAHS
jgi:heat shock factor-binding protein 1